LASYAQGVSDELQARNIATLAERDVLDAPSHEEVLGSIADDIEVRRIAAERGEAEHPQALARTGLHISLDLPVFVIADGQVFANALHALPEDCPQAVRTTVTRIIDFSLRYAVNWELSQGNHVLQSLPGLLVGREFSHLSLMPEDFSENDLFRYLLPDPAQRELVGQATEQASEHAARILPKLRKAGVEEPLVERFRGFALAAAEGLLTEWAMAADLGAFEDHADRAMGHPWKSWDEMDWERVYLFLQHLAGRAAPNSLFVEYVRANMLTRIEEQHQQLASRPGVTEMSEEEMADGLLARPTAQSLDDIYSNIELFGTHQDASRYRTLESAATHITTLLPPEAT
jgi:hypothetical protein